MAGRYAYGFNLGQIEGLDSSVKTVTLTIANATESNTYTLTYTTDEYDNDLWTDDINFENDSIKLYHYTGEEVFKLRTLFLTPNDVGDTYNVTLSTSAVEENFKSAVETVLVDNGLISAPETLFDGTITITDGPVEIPFVMDVSSYPFEKWMVTVNDESLEYNGEVFYKETETHTYVVGNINGVYKFLARDADGVIPGDYRVKITGIAGEGGGDGSSGLPDVSASDNGSVLGVINGEWGVDDRLNAYPRIDNLGSGTYGFRQGREKIKPSQIVPIPITEAEAYYDIGAFYLPFSGSEEKTPHYKKAITNPPIIPSYYNICFLVANSNDSNEPSFAFENAVISKTNTDGVYTLKATVSNGTISLAWVRDT